MKPGPKKAESIQTTELCKFGCGQTAKFLNKSGGYMCSGASSGCPNVKMKNSAAARIAYNSESRIPAKEQYARLSNDTKNKMNWNKGNFTADFNYGGIGSHKAVLLIERGHRCEECKLTSWNEQLIPLELEHSDGDNRNNTRENLKLLCCNCHALTPTWRGRNINSGKFKVSDQDLLTAYKNCSNIRQALTQVGLAAKGGNYLRLQKLIAGMVE